MTQFPHPPSESMPPKKKGMSSGAVIAIVVASCFIVLLFCGGLLAGIMLPALGKARQSARMIKSSSQMRGVVQGLQLYANENGGELPEPGADLAQRIGPYVGGTDLFIAPDAQPGMTTYFYFPAGNLNQLKDPTNTILVYEHPDLRRGMLNVGFADGSIRPVDQSELTRLLGTLQLPDGTPWAPHVNAKQPSGFPQSP